MVMGLLSVFLIGIGLSMDAFAVSLSACLTWHGDRYRTALKLGLFFGGFQALMPALGWLCGTRLHEFSIIATLDHWIAFGLLAFVGGKMIWAAWKNRGGECIKEHLTLKTLLLLSFATSIDAFAVGLSFAMLAIEILVPVLLIGVTTFAISFAGALLGERLGRFAGKGAEFLGGGLLIAIGLRILCIHL
ncbi:MAG: manganese efflux pump MntP family protein [Fibrobacterota bacterium]